ncbi:MAG: hypothetical protein VR69_07065 [Peptococcaceae bacterium BRH_c4b]|nr:MAG: hypothetical protein VR69_07065 [Peptococcaceae bacterium BRH_c4b]
MKLFNTKGFFCAHSIFDGRFSSPMLAIDKTEANTLAKKVRGFLDLQSYINENEVHFTNPKDKITCGVMLDRIGMSSIENINIETFQDYIKKFVAIVSDVLDIQKFARFGFRVVYIDQRDSMEEAIKNIYKISTLDQKIIKGVGDLTGFMIRFSTDKHGLKTNISINPGQNQNIVINTEGSEVNVKYGIFIDVDMYIEEMITLKKLNVFLDDTSRHLKNEVFAMLNSIEVR